MEAFRGGLKDLSVHKNDDLVILSLFSAECGVPVSTHNQWTCENQIRRDVPMARAMKGEGHQMMRDSPLVTDMPRDKYVERCKQRALDYLDRGDIEKAVTSIITTMDARTDCKIPHYLAIAWRFADDGKRCARSR